MRLFQGCFFIIIPAFTLKCGCLLYDDTGLVGLCLVPESYDSSEKVSNDSSEENEDEEPD